MIREKARGKRYQVEIDGEKKLCVLRWYLRPGHVFGFNRMCEVKYGGVILTHTDIHGVNYCYDDEITNI